MDENYEEELKMFNIIVGSNIIDVLCQKELFECMDCQKDKD